MIVLNPAGGSNVRVIEANGLKDYDVNYKFASFLGKYLQQRNEPLALTRATSECLTKIEYDRFLNNNAPDVIINVKCLEDISTDPQGYTVDCDKYSALAATISLELNKWGAKTVYPIGYKINNFVTVAKYTEITIGLGYITNTTDAARIGDDAKLDALAKAIVDAAYGPPTKMMQPVDDVLISDPYFYTVDKWKEVASSKGTGDEAKIVDTLIENIPAKVLKFTTGTTAKTIPLEWYTETLEPEPGKEYMVIVSARSLRTGGKAYVKIGDKVEEPVYTDNSWHRITLTPDYKHVEKLYLGAYETADIEYTAVWLTPIGHMGSLDDPMSNYSIFPPGYRPLTNIDPTAVDKKLVQSVITEGNSLMSRAQDNKAPATGSAVQQMMSKVDEVPISPKALVGATQGMATQFGNLDLKKINIIDPTKIDTNKIKGDCTMLENMTKNMSRVDKKGDLLKSINDMKGVDQAATQLTKSYDQKLADAKKKADAIQKRMQKKGEAMGKP